MSKLKESFNHLIYQFKIFQFDGFVWLKPEVRYWGYIDFYTSGTLACGFGFWFFCVGWSFS